MSERMNPSVFICKDYQPSSVPIETANWKETKLFRLFAQRLLKIISMLQGSSVSWIEKDELKTSIEEENI